MNSKKLEELLNTLKIATEGTDAAVRLKKIQDKIRAEWSGTEIHEW